MLYNFSSTKILEAGVDEAGRGSYIGAVFAAAVILDDRLTINNINDSKKLSALKRQNIAEEIKEKSLAWAISSVDEHTIDKINILQASILAMHQAIQKLPIQPKLLLIDGNRFNTYKNIPHKTIIRGDGIYASIAAASILAKTARDAYILNLHKQYPNYGWDKNKGYGTLFHRQIIIENGLSPFHRKSFHII